MYRWRISWKLKTWALAEGRDQQNELQTGSSFVQDYRVWRVSSGWAWQALQTSVVAICLQTRLVIVGKASLHARQEKCLSLFGTISCHKLLQNNFWFSTNDVPTRLVELRETRSLHALFVMNILEGVRPHIILSGGSLMLRGTPQITVASWGRKSWFTKDEFHPLNSKLIRELTLVSGATEGRDEMKVN